MGMRLGGGVLRRRNRPRYAVFEREDGSKFFVDGHAVRLARCRRRLGKWADVLKETVARSSYYFVGVALTYDRLGTLTGIPAEWSPLDVSGYMRAVRLQLGSALIAYCWVGEVQKNGNVHYHGLLVVRRGVSVPMPDKSGAWTKGMSRLTSKVNSVGYLLRYAGKKYQKDFDLYPAGMRLFAVWFADQDLKLRLRLRSLSPQDSYIFAVVGWRELNWLSCYRPYFSRAPPVRFVATLRPAEMREYAKARGLEFDG